MADKKPFVFTGACFVVSKSGGNPVRCREEIVFEQVSSPKGTYKFTPVKRRVLMPESEQLKCDEKMMRSAGEVLSGVLPNSSRIIDGEIKK